MKNSLLISILLCLLTGCNPPAKHIALTFDDGPNTSTTHRILDVLEKHGAVGSFFVIGDNINEASAGAMKRAISLGCDIQNHSRSHPYMSKLTHEQILQEVQYTSNRIEHYTGTAPVFFRAPYIDVTDAMYKLIDMPFVCGEGCDDWNREVGVQERIERTLRQAEDGQIVLLHDFEGNEATAEALEAIIPALKKEGYRFVTVGELFQEKGIVPQRGKLYSNVLKD